MNKIKSITKIITLLGSFFSIPMMAITNIEHLNWQDFIARSDLVWNESPRQWSEGGFVGNGQLGMMVYADLDSNCLVFHLGRADVTDHRLAPDRKTSFGVPGANTFFHYPRLDIGLLTLTPAGKIQSVTMRQNLWNAEITGTITTDLGIIQFRAFTPRTYMVNIIEIESTEQTNNDQLAGWTWRVLPGNPDSPRALIYPGRYEYESNPAPVKKVLDGMPVIEQPLLAGGDYATAWVEYETGKNSARLFITTANEVPKAGKSAEVAVRTVQEVSDEDFSSMLKEHRRWWHDFYQRSFVSVPDPLLESFYWIQLYKLGSAAREDGPPIDLFGPWFKMSIWPGMWWNLNVQLTYWPLAPANHLDLSKTLINEIDQNWDGLVTHFGETHRGQAMGDLAWVLHNYWLHYRHSGQWQPLAEKWLPKAVQVLEMYTQFLDKKPNGEIHLAPMGSPEFMGFKPFRNTNYNLGLIRWLVSAIESLHHETGAGAESLKIWSPIVKNLVDYPTDENGLMIGSDQSFSESHRHFSHMIGFYPLFEMDVEKPAVRDVLNRSIEHWLNIKNRDGSQDRVAYTLAAAASMYAALGLGDQGVTLLHEAINNQGIRDLILPNTFNTHGGRNVTFETPPALANATLEMLLQSWGGRVRVFHGTPQQWEDAVFHNLRARGGFLVSAERKNGRTAWVAVESLTGQPLKLNVPDWDGPLSFAGSRDFEVRRVGTDYVIDLQKGERILLSPTSNPVKEGIVQALSRAGADYNPFGLKPGEQLRRRLDWVVPAPQLLSNNGNLSSSSENLTTKQTERPTILWNMNDPVAKRDDILLVHNVGDGTEELSKNNLHKLTVTARDGKSLDLNEVFIPAIIPLDHRSRPLTRTSKTLNFDKNERIAVIGDITPISTSFFFETKIKIEQKFNENVWIAEVPDKWSIVLENNCTRISLFVWDDEGQMHRIRLGINPHKGWQRIRAGFHDGEAFLNVEGGDSGHLPVKSPFTNHSGNTLYLGMRRNHTGFLIGQIDYVSLSESNISYDPQAISESMNKDPEVYAIIESIPVAKVWAGHPVGFALLTDTSNQYVAFFDSERRMTVGSRPIESFEWTLQQLPSQLGWDSHNYVTMALDQGGHLHVSGNMHGDPLVYFRSANPHDITSLEKINYMTGEREGMVTYPVFLTGPDGSLIFNYRDGSSRAGTQVYNIYDEKSRTWRRLTDQPLSDGEGVKNAYFEGPTLGPDGFYHLSWIWRDSGCCSTNHTLSYARSPDLVNWETALGRSIDLPIRFTTPGVVVNPIPVSSGLLNGNGKIGFDSLGRVVLTYHKFDEAGNTQLFNARLEGDDWVFYQVTDWNYRWDFSGHGTIEMKIWPTPVYVENGKLKQEFRHRIEGSGIFILDESTMKPIETVPLRRWPAEITQVRSSFPGMGAHRRFDLSESESDCRYILRWETLGRNRDIPRDPPWPEPSLLEVIKIK